MSLLTLVQNACNRIGVLAPTTVIGNTDQLTIQFLALANEEGQELSERYEWQALRAEATFVTVAAELQGNLSAIAPGLKSITNDTIWDRDTRRPIFGPLAPQRWQQLKALAFVGPWYQFRIFNNEIRFIPAPAAGDSCFFEYTTKNWVATSGNSASSWTADTDTALLDEDILCMGLIWRWKAAKGMVYTQDFDKYERRILDAMAADASKDILNLGDERYDIFPGVIVPSGSWAH